MSIGFKQFVAAQNPGVAPAGTAREYFDSATNQLMVSQNGNSYVPATGGTLNLRPIDGTSDDWPTLITKIIAATTLGFSVTMLPGLAGEVWQCKTGQLNLPPKAHIIGTPKTRILATLPTASVADAVFTSDGTFGASTTLTAGNTVGGRTFALAAIPSGCVVGAVICVEGASPQSARSLTYTVVAIAALVVTVERPILEGFASGSAVKVFTNQPDTIIIEGNGMGISVVTAARVVEFLRAKQCYVGGLNIDAAAGMVLAGSYVVSMDTGGHENTLEDLFVDGGSPIGSGPGAAIAFEMQERSTMINCTATRASKCIAALDVLSCSFFNCNAYNDGTGGDGFKYSANSTVAAANRNCKVIGGSFVGNVNGFVFSNGCLDCILVGASATYNQVGIGLLNQSSTPQRNNLIQGCSVTDNTGSGLSIAANVQNTIVVGGSYRQNPTGITCTSSATTIDGASFGANTGGYVAINAGTANVTIKNCMVRWDTPNNDNYFMQTSTGNVTLDGVIAECNDGAVNTSYLASVSGAGQVTISNCRVFGTQSANNKRIAHADSGGTAFFGAGNQFAGCTNVFDPGGGASYFSRGQTIVADGTGNPQTITFPKIQASDVVTLRRSISAGTPTAFEPLCVITAATKIDVTFGVADLSTYVYSISS